MDRQQVIELLKKYESGNISSEEKALLESWYIKQANESKHQLSEEALEQSFNYLKAQLPIEGDKAASINAASVNTAGAEFESDNTASINAASDNAASVKTRRLWPRIAVAAAIACVVLGAYFFSSTFTKQDQDHTSIYANDLAPGTSGATLTLANGNKIKLNNAANGQLASQAGISITKTASGQLIYEIKGNAASENQQGVIKNQQDVVNTLSTDKGETYQLRLPDGSKVWLNAASRITYVASLISQGVRKVTLEGEAYFEIFKDKAHPFVVATSKQEIEVLGTHFNVNSYSDEPSTKTTLLEGSVKVKPNTTTNNAVSPVILKPGQEASLQEAGKFVISESDTELAMAWVNNKFIFQDTDVKTIMRMVSRWYNVEVVYDGPIPQDHLGGSVSRFDNISSVLKILESTGGLHFKLEGRKLHVFQ